MGAERVAVRLTAPLTINVTGYDAQPTVYAAGEQSVPARVAEHVRRHPELGQVLDGDAAPAPAPDPADDGSQPPADVGSDSAPTDCGDAGDPDDSAPADEGEPEALAGLTVPELRALATERGIEGMGKAKRAELIAALTAGEQE